MSGLPGIHPWLREVRVFLAPGPMTGLLEEVTRELLDCLRSLGHQVQSEPDDGTDLILSTARFGEPISWRKAPLFTGRRRLGLSHTPTVCTLVHTRPEDLQRTLARFEVVLAKDTVDPADYEFPGLAPRAYEVLSEQGRRGGPMLALTRVVQGQAKCLRGAVIVGEDSPTEAYNFDLVGAHPRTDGADAASFYQDIALRLATAVGTAEVNQHEPSGEPIPRAAWDGLTTPAAMCEASRQFGERGFFTEMVYIANLVPVPAISDAVASQYSEGCFATWEPALGALIATVTGSARPVDKGNITDDELAVIVGIRPGGEGVWFRPVEDKSNPPPSSEAVETMAIDLDLPTVVPDGSRDESVRVPVARSKLHAHRGIAAYDPQLVEYAPLDAPYYRYLVTCGTEAQAWGIKGAFSRAKSLRNPADPRPVVFTVLPGHGVFIVEKWVSGKAPFQAIWEFMDAGALEVENHIPQGPMGYTRDPGGRMVLQAR